MRTSNSNMTRINKISFEEFVRKQEEIYRKFKDNEKFKSGEKLKPDAKKTGGYLIAYRHDQEFSEKIAEFSEKISKKILSIKYSSENIHTTISDFMVSEKFEYNSQIMWNIANYIDSKRKELAAPTIGYYGFGFDDSTVIAMGKPSGAFLHNAEILDSKAYTFGLGLRLPESAHITTNRFLKEMNAPEGLYELINSRGPGISIPTTIDAGHFSLDENGFEFNVYVRFHIKR